ncbi:sporulation integral membrane protein YlbJ [Gracilibacillus ureilyticus]|uniref:Sporulation integral membrane protein YlbJ n=1 Tax=Gracilibacillus ureilyticus TaxID=531814 RepID=A0A1H9THZ8_9BACI|nr:sporulation integral membrane protein YlbJ [Gracilibacillus ureilyticus]SER96815.1 sporulation integral membrane protein YlbJ [Gracilibacillus ureilyticus]
MKYKAISIMYALFALFMALSIIMLPQAVLESSKKGIEMWASVVFPSLLPFFIVAELFIAFGVVHFIGVLFEPIMRPLFNVPGVGGFVWAMGMASGYPSGAKFTVRLRQENQLSKIEAERLVSFTNASNPLFIIGAVSIGFFHDQQLGILLALTHYISNFFVGICMRFYKRNIRSATKKEPFSFKKAFEKLHQTRMNDNRPLGKILGDSIIQSIHTLLLIGGFITLFSVLTRIFHEVKVMTVLANFLAVILDFFHLPVELAPAFLSGLFEITLGAQQIASGTGSTLVYAILLSFILAFNGLSVQAQVASLLAETDIRFYPYFFARLLHGIFASFLVIALFRPVYLVGNSQGAQPVWSEYISDRSNTLYTAVQEVGMELTIISLIVFIFLTIKQRSYK